jgi:hypothetical protein
VAVQSRFLGLRLRRFPGADAQDAADLRDLQSIVEASSGGTNSPQPPFVGGVVRKTLGALPLRRVNWRQK